MARRFPGTTAVILCLLLALGWALPASAQQSSGQDEAMTAADVAAVLAVINQAELRLARLARQRSEDEEVREYAHTLQEQHAQLDEEVLMALEGNPSAPESVPIARQIQQQAQAMEGRLNGLSDQEFDQAFIQSQRQMHEKAVRIIENDLLPQTQSRPMRVVLLRAKEHMQAHLQRARELSQRPSR